MCEDMQAEYRHSPFICLVIHFCSSFLYLCSYLAIHFISISYFFIFLNNQIILFLLVLQLIRRIKMIIITSSM